MQAISVKNVNKRFGGFQALNGVSFEVNEGEIFGLLGPNGAGKSTMISILMGFERPDSGEFSYFIGGRKLGGCEIDEKVSIVPQQLCFYNNFSVEKNLKFMGTLYGLGRKQLKQRVEFLLEKWSLAQFRKREARFLSGGYKRLLNIACGLINDPTVIFLDEPTVGLDPEIRQTFWEKIKELKKAGKTIILTTHYMDEAEHLCDRIAIIIKGKISFDFMVAGLLKDGVGVEDLFLKTVAEAGVKREDI
jgi:ABC-2 type transport system ATP-binding protein